MIALFPSNGVVHCRCGCTGCPYVCEGGALGTVAVPESWSNCSPRAAAERPLTAEVLADLAQTLSAIEGR